MRFFSKYKIYKKLRSIPVKHPLRILKFKRPKWKLVQKKLSFLQSKKRKSIKFVNFYFKKKSNKNWSKVKSTYKDGLREKNEIFTILDFSFSKNWFKKQNLNLSLNKNFLDLYLKNIILPHYRIDFLLSNLYFFKTCYQAREAINNGLVLVNQRSVLGNYFLKKGDIISIKDVSILSNTFQIKDFFLSFSKNTFFIPFLECDFYTKTVIIIKDVNTLTNKDFLLLNQKRFDLKRFLDYIK